MRFPMFLQFRCPPGAPLAIVLMICLVQCIIPRHVEAQQGSYTVYSLAPVEVDGGLCESFGRGISEAAGNTRMVVGYANTDGADPLPVVWMVDDSGTSEAIVLDFPSELFAGGAVGVSLNNHGQIVGGGIFDPSTSASVGLYWPNALAMPIAFPSLPGETLGFVQEIGDSGVVVGISESASGRKAVAWRVMPDDSIAGPIVLPTRSQAAGGDDAALGVRSMSPSKVEIVGRSAGAPVAWKVNLSATGLTLSGGAEVLGSTLEATGVNSTGSICGNTSKRVVVWSRRVGTKRTKTTLQYNSKVFGTAGRSSAINALDMVVGDAFLKGANPKLRAVIWTSLSAPMRTLESLTNGDHSFLHLDSASAINNAGEIAGYGWQGAEGGYQAFIAIPNN